MISVSDEFKQHMAADNRKFLVFLDFLLMDGTKLPTIENNDLWEGGFKLDDGVTVSGQFTVGSCIINKLTVTLNNIYDKFSPYDFEGASVAAYLGLELSDGRVEKIRKGVFTVDEPTYNGSTITLECLDNMYKLDRDYSDIKTTYPATLGTIVRDICSVCGVTLLTTTFSNYQYIIEKRPSDDALTCRQVLSYAAQLACCFARCDTFGRMELRWFEQGIFEDGAVLNGGIFDEGTPSYISGDNADGGTFNPWNVAHAADAGTFNDQNKFHHLYSYSSLNTSTDDIVITGVQVTDEREETETSKKQTYLYGNKGYLLSISDNKFVEKGKAQTVATYLGQRLVGLRFRKMSGQFSGDPRIEAGDLAYVTDRKQNTYNCLITNLSFTIGNYMSISCDAETPSKNSAKRYSELTQAVVEARKYAQVQISEYDLAVQQLTSMITQSFGIYNSKEEISDGSFIYYMHDKPTVAQSTTIWKMTRDAFAVSTDGGKTWNAGIDANGNAVVNVLSAIGIRFDWAKGGTLTLGGVNNINGALVLLDANGNTLATLNNLGLNLLKGVIKGSSIQLGGANNTNGTLKVSNSSGNQIGSWDNKGITILSGSINTTDGTRSSKLADGRMYFYLGNDVSTMISSFYWGNDTSKEGSVFLTSKQYLGLGHGSASWSSDYIINNGLNPDGYTDRHIFYGSARYLNSISVPNVIFGNGTYISGFSDSNRLNISNGLNVSGNFTVSNGQKSRLVKTKSQGSVSLYAFETPEPYFSDIGSGIITDNNRITVFFDPVFAETVDQETDYQVFITRTSVFEISFVEKFNGYFIVHGANGASFDWMLTAKQRDYSMTRLECVSETENNEMGFDDSIFIKDSDELILLNQLLEEYNRQIDLL